MSRSIRRALAVGILILASGRSSAECQPRDLTVVLNTGWDQDAGAVIPAGPTADGDWEVIVDPSGGPVPRDADVVNPHPAWLTMPNSQWITASYSGQFGTYVYRTCWCMDDDFASPNLGIAIRADDQADVFLNGTLIWSLPEGTFNDAIAPGMSFINPALFHAGRNCLDVAVKQIHGAVTGFNLVGTFTADDGLCCPCLEADILDDAATGIDDLTSGPIVSGLDDDEWMVTASASGGVLPRPATVIDKYVGWDLIPFTKWITADATGPAGLYTYEKCWCMNPSFQNAVVSLTLLADDRASVFLNGSLIGSTPLSGAYLFPPTSITTGNQSLFRAGENCVTIDVHNSGPFATGLDVAMSVSATNAECCPCTELPPDAEGWWPLDETAGITAAELLHGHDGTWVGGPFPMPGKVLGSLDLDGTDDHVAVPDDPGLDFDAGQDFSFDAWIKTGTSTRQVILQKRKPGSPLEPGYSFMTGGVLTLEIADGTHVHTCNGTIFVADNEWHFVAATAKRDLSRIRLYVDSAMQTCFSTTMIGSLVNAEQLYFGADPLAAPIARKWWNGQLDEIEIFRRELDPTEVEAIHLADHAGKCRPEPCEDSTGVPVCAGTCSTGLTCVAGSPPFGPCQCVQAAATCEGSAPQCNGSCPDPDDVCVGNGPTCHCEPPPPVACGDSPYPVCNGACPANQQCMQAPNQSCACFTCGTGVPSDPVVVEMAPGREIRWTPVTCALVYNVYRGVGSKLRDQNADGLADDYGSCHVGDIIGNRVVDPVDPHPQGVIHWYLVTAESFGGEGSLGENSAGQPRQPTSVCP